MKLTNALPLFIASISATYAQDNSTSSTSSSGGSSFAGGFIVTRTNVDTHAALALDIRDMTTELEQGSISSAELIYSQGKNSQKYDNAGNPTTKRTLKGFSTAATSGKFDLEPAFWYHIWGISGGDYENKDNYLTYADQYVEGLLNSGSSTTASLAAEAATVLNTWMYVAHEIYDGLNDCRTAEAGQNNENIEDNGLGVNAIDEAVAFWVGAEQELKLGTGYSMFEIAQQADYDFGIDGSGANGYVSLANQLFKQYYEEMRTVLALEDRCYPNSGTTKKLYYLTDRMISAMTIPLMQKLIHSIVEGDKELIKLYALAIVPQISACKSSVAQSLWSKLYENDYDGTDRAGIIAMLQSAYNCLGFTCADIGPYKTNVIPECADRPSDSGLAGYKPSTATYETSKIDLDIKQIMILCRYASWTPASEIYGLGKNSVISTKDFDYVTLKDMATSNTRDVADPFYNYFVSYNGNTADYADEIVQGALDGTGKFSSMSDLQRGEFAFKTMQYQITYMHALTLFYSGIQKCKAGNAAEEIVSSWDQGVAYLVGSIEGPYEGGAPTSDGTLMYNLANKRCEEFGTCDEEGMAKVIPSIMEALTSGQSAANSLDCNALTAAAETVAHLVMIPVMQGCMRYGIKNQIKEVNSDSKDLAEGEVFSRSVLPLVDQYDGVAATVLESNLFIQAGVQPVADGSQAVADAVGSAAPSFGVSCADLGMADGADPCLNNDGSSGIVAAGRLSVWGVGVVAVISSVLSMFN